MVNKKPPLKWEQYFQNPSWRKTGYGVLALAAHVMCGLTALGVCFSIMLFDAPQSARNPVVKTIFGLVIAGPFVFWLMKSHAMRAFSGEQARALFVFVLPAVWLIAIAVAFTAW